MTTTQALAILGLIIGVIIIVYYSALSRVRRDTQKRLLDADAESLPPSDDDEQARDRKRGLARWLLLAGFRGTGAVPAFTLAAVIALAVAGIAALVVSKAGIVESLGAQVAGSPGGFGNVFVLILQFAPHIIFLIIASLPWMFVRSTRANRILDIEADLPVTLEIMASLAEAGLAFDGAIERIVASSSEARPLLAEMSLYRRETQAGLSRIRALRRLAQRVDISSLTLVISSLIQAEQIGASIADTIRIQADELRKSRRQKALVQAQALPVKLVFPLVICFLPGVFVTTLGPAFNELFGIIDSIVRK